MKRPGALAPLNGWRAFWGEVGIIVLGVLIALGAQQLVEDWSDRQRVRKSLDALRTEMKVHARGFYGFQQTAPCVNAQIDRIEAKLVSGDPSPLAIHVDPGRPGVFVIRIPTRAFADAAWNSIEGTDTIKLLDPELVSVASNYYGRFDNLRHFNLDAVAQVAALNSLARMMPRDESTRMHFIERLEQLREDMSRLELASHQLRDNLAEIDMLPDDATVGAEVEREGGTLAFCRKNALPIAKVKPADPD